MPNKYYLGDGVYVEWEFDYLTLTTENGLVTTNRIVLEPDVYAALVRYVDKLRKYTRQASQ